MNYLILLTIATLAIIPTADCLKCHYCESTRTDLACFQARVKKECYASYRCVKTMHKMQGVQYYTRGCMAKSYCDPDSFCRADPDRTNCEVYCCDGDYCNTGSTKSVSVFLCVGLSLIALLCSF